MDHISQQRDSCFQISFMKGMTLQQYMAGLTFSSHQRPTYNPKNPDQDLFQSSINPQLKELVTKNKANLQKRVNQQPSNQLKESSDIFKKKGVADQPTKGSFSQAKQLKGNDKSTFRIKHFSNSPVKKIKQNKLSTTSVGLKTVTLDHLQQLESPQIKQITTIKAEIATVQQSLEIKKQGKVIDSRRNIKKTNSLYVRELNQIQNKIKHKYPNQSFLPDIKIQGIKDKVLMKINKI